MTSIMTRRTGLLSMGAFALSACASPTITLNPDITPIAFEGGRFPITVNLIRLNIPVRLPAQGAVPVDADFVVTIEDIAKLWPNQRLQAVGGQSEANWIIDDASAVARPTPQGEVVIGTMQVRLVILGADGAEQASAGARVESELRISGSPNIAQRQELLHGMVIEMAAELDKQMGASIARMLPRYIGSGTL